MIGFKRQVSTPSHKFINEKVNTTHNKFSRGQGKEAVGTARGRRLPVRYTV